MLKSMMKPSPLWNRSAGVVMAVYFVQGAAAVAGLAEFLLVRNVFAFTWIQISLLAALSMLTWSIKPIYGFLTDLLPLFGYRRKSYLLLASLLPFLGYGFLGLEGTSFLMIAIALVIANIGLGFSDVIVDGLIVERSNSETVGWYQTLCWRAKAFGMFFAAIFSGLLIERGIFSNLLGESGIIVWLQHYFPHAFPHTLIVQGLNLIDIRFTFIATALLPLITFALAFFLEEESPSRDLIAKGRKEVPSFFIISAGAVFIATIAILVFISPKPAPFISMLGNDALSSLLIIAIWTFWIIGYGRHLVQTKMATNTLLFAALFLFLWRFTPSFGAPWTDYFLNTLSLSREKLGALASLQPLGWIVGSFLYIRFLDKLPLKRVLTLTVLISFFLSFTQLTVASPDLGAKIGSWAPIKHLSAILLTPTYLLIYGGDFWREALGQAPILNLDAVLSFFLQIVYIAAFLPILKLAALVTPKGVEATNFAILMSVTNLGLVFGSVVGGLIYTGIEGEVSFGPIHTTGLHLTIIIGAFASLLCLLVLPKLNLEEIRSP